MTRRRKSAPSLAAAQAALTSPSPQGRDFTRRCNALREAAEAQISAEAWSTILDLRAWASQHPLFSTPDAPLRGLLRRWEEALLSGAPLPLAASLVRDDVATATCGPWDRLAARAPWAELRPLLRDDAAAWSVAEGRVLRGESLGGRGPHSGMPLQLYRWEPSPALPHYTSSGMSWGDAGFSAEAHPLPLPPPISVLPHEPAWDAMLAPWSEWTYQLVKVEGTAEQALACLLGGTEALVGACTWQEAIAVLMQMHGNPAPYTEGRGMVAARRAVWRLFAALADTGWPVSGDALEAAMNGWRWLRYDPGHADALSSVFLALADPHRGLAWGVYAWVTD